MKWGNEISICAYSGQKCVRSVSTILIKGRGRGYFVKIQLGEDKKKMHSREMDKIKWKTCEQQS